jgi:hypothetical protein
MGEEPGKAYSAEETERRREAGLKRLLAMPPEPRGKPASPEGGKKRGRPAKPRDQPSS